MPETLTVPLTTLQFSEQSRQRREMEEAAALNLGGVVSFRECRVAVVSKDGKETHYPLRELVPQVLEDADGPAVETVAE